MASEELTEPDYGEGKKKLGGLFEGIARRRAISSLYPMTLLYLACIGVAGVPMRVAIRMLSRPEPLGPVSTVFAKIQTMVEKWGYLQAQAFRAAANDVDEPNMKGLLLRLAHAVQAGVNLEDFSRIEFQKFLTTSEAEFEKILEKVRRSVEAYGAMLSSIGFLSVSFLLMTTIFGGARSVLELSLVAIFTTLGGLTILFARNHARRRLIHNQPHKPPALHSLESSTFITIGGSLFVLVFFSVFFAGIPLEAGSLMSFLVPGPLAMISSSAGLFMHGLLGRKWLKRTHEKEAQMPVLLRSLGDYISVTGSPAAASRMMMLSDYGALNTDIANLAARIRMGVTQSSALKLLGLESLSDLSYKCLTVYGETLKAGGRAGPSAAIINDYMTSVLIRDKKRKQLAGNLKGIVVPLQATLVAIFGLMNSLMTIFGKIAALVSQFISLITPLPPFLTTIYFYWITVAVALFSALNVYLIEGESVFTFTLFAGILLSISGLTYLAVSAGTFQLLAAFSRIGENISRLVPQ